MKLLFTVAFSLFFSYAGAHLYVWLCDVISLMLFDRMENINAYENNFCYTECDAKHCINVELIKNHLPPPLWFDRRNRRLSSICHQIPKPNVEMYSSLYIIVIKYMFERSFL